jgi:beta-aspartyl-peptidase (threonine type)
MTIQEQLSLSRHPKPSPYTLVIHGGAGAIRKEHSTPEQCAAYKKALSQALLAVSFWIIVHLLALCTNYSLQGYQVLHDNGDAMDAVTAAVTVMEGLMVRLVHRWTFELLSLAFRHPSV